MSVIETITMSIYIAFGAMALIGFLVGLFKGMFRSIADLGFMVFNIVVSVITANILARSIAKPDVLCKALDKLIAGNSFDPATMDTIVQLRDSLANPEVNTTAVSLIVALVSVIILPLLFMVIYFLLAAIMKIPKLIIEFVFIHKTRRWSFKFIGAGIGAISAVIALAVLIMPVLGYVDYANETFELLNEVQAVEENDNTATPMESNEGEGGSNIVDTILSYTQPINDNFMVKTVNTLGGRALFNSLSTIKVDDTKVSLKNETQCGIKIYGEFSHFKGPIKEYGQEQIDALDRIEDIIFEAEFTPSFIANTLSFVSNEWDNGRTVFGMEKPYIGTELQAALDGTIHTLSSMTEDTFKQDFATISELFKSFIENGAVSVIGNEDKSQIMVVIKDTDVLADILVALHNNPRFKGVIPALANGIENYVYKVYDEVNGTTTPKSEMTDISSLTEENVRKEADTIVNSIVEIDAFIKSIKEYDLKGETMEALVNSDFGALGRGLNSLKASFLFGDMFDFLLTAVLKSETCAELGIIDDAFIENAGKDGADLEKMLLSRQKLAILIMALKSGDKTEYSDAVKTIMESISEGDSESLKQILTYSNLRGLGVSKDKAQSISRLLSTMVTTLDGHEYTEEETAKEAESTGKIIGAVNSALENKDKGGNIFSSEPVEGEEQEESLSNLTATEVVESAMNSEVVTAMIKDAVHDEEGNVVDDPYHVQNNLTESDKESMKEALASEYNKEGVKDDPEKVESLENIAHIFGIDTSEIFK